jgi:hypothetical protein
MSVGLSKRQISSMINSTIDNMKHQLPLEYNNVLVRQGRARDTAFSTAEQDMEAMCDAYRVLIVQAVSDVIDANNRRVHEDVKALIQQGPSLS